MPLINCLDCNNEISDLAPSCPHCGRPNKVAPRIPSGDPVSREDAILNHSAEVVKTACLAAGKALKLTLKSEKPSLLFYGGTFKYSESWIRIEIEAIDSNSSKIRYSADNPSNIIGNPWKKLLRNFKEELSRRLYTSRS